MALVAIERSVRLTCHPAVRAAAIRQIDVRVGRSAGGALSLAYRLEGEIELIRVPAARAARAADRLWEHTCFEAFIARDGERAYHELNFSPSGECAAFAFRDTRDGGMIDGEELAPEIHLHHMSSALELEARVSLDRLQPSYRGSVLRLGLSAVVETRDGVRSYWALRHPAEQPDFHHVDAFALRLEAA